MQRGCDAAATQRTARPPALVGRVLLEVHLVDVDLRTRTQKIKQTLSSETRIASLRKAMRPDLCFTASLSSLCSTHRALHQNQQTCNTRVMFRST